MAITLSHGTRIPLVEVTKGMRLQAARRDAGISQERMAEMMGCSRRTITRWETEDTAPPAVVIAYSVATDVNLGWLETGTPRWDDDTEFVPARGGKARPKGLEPLTFWSVVRENWCRYCELGMHRYCSGACACPGAHNALDVDLTFWSLVHAHMGNYQDVGDLAENDADDHERWCTADSIVA